MKKLQTVRKNQFYIFFSIIIAVALVSCKAGKHATDGDTIIIDGNTPKDTITQIDPIDTTVLVMDTTILDTIVEEKIIKQSEYHIAIVMPFWEDSVRGNWSRLKEKDYNDYKLPKESEISLSFLEGVMIALEEMDIDSGFQITLYDNKKSTAGTNTAIEKMRENQPDIIIGPYSKNNVKLVAEFALANNLMHISPFSPSKSVGVDNPNYIMVQPSINQHIASMLDYAIDSLENPNIKVIHENTESGKNYASFISDYLNQRNDTIENSAKRINYALVGVASNANDRRYFNVGGHLDYEESNAVIIPSFEDGFIHAMLAQINDKIEKYDIHTFGMPTWIKSENLRLEYFNSLQVYFSNSTWTKRRSDEKKDFEDTYKDRYEKKPTEYACYGFDIMQYFGTLVDQHGLACREALVDNNYEGLMRNYDFETASDYSKVENKSIFITRFEEYSFKLKK